MKSAKKGRECGIMETWNQKRHVDLCACLLRGLGYLGELRLKTGWHTYTHSDMGHRITDHEDYKGRECVILMDCVLGSVMYD